MASISVEGLVHVYPNEGIRAIDGIDLKVEAGERVAIIGQNGSGKSTLVRHLNGLLRPSQGRVRLDGKDARPVTVAQLAHTVGLVFQDPDQQTFAGSVYAEVEFGPRNLGYRGDALRSAVTRALVAVGLEGETKTNPYDLGGSRRKLLSLASVLAMETQILVLDEPTTGQDQRGIDLVQSIIDAVQAQGRTVIVVSHDMRFVAETFERVIVMGAGRVLLDSTPDQVFSRASWETLASTYLEPPRAAAIGERAGLGSTPTDTALIQRLAARQEPV
jgi:energy-coupling factor transport system ATP-binding protein